MNAPFPIPTIQSPGGLAGITITDVPWTSSPRGKIAATGKQAFRFSGFTSDRIGFIFEQPPIPYNYMYGDGDYAWGLPRVFVNGTEVFPFPADPYNADTFPDGQVSGDPGVYESGVGGLYVNKLPGVTAAGPTPGPIFTGDTSGTGGTGGTPGPIFTGDTSGTGGTPGPTTPGATIAPTEIIIFADSYPRVQGWTFTYGCPELDLPPTPTSDVEGASAAVPWSSLIPSLISPEEWSQSNWYETNDFFGIFLPSSLGYAYCWPFADPVGGDYNNPADYLETAPGGGPPGQQYRFYFLPEAYVRTGFLKVLSNPGASSGFTSSPWSYIGAEDYYPWSKGDKLRLWTGRGSYLGGYVDDGSEPYPAGLLKVWDGARWSIATSMGSPNTPPGADWPSNFGPQPGPLFTGDDTGSGGGTPGPLFTG